MRFWCGVYKALDSLTTITCFSAVLLPMKHVGKLFLQVGKLLKRTVLEMKHGNCHKIRFSLAVYFS